MSGISKDGVLASSADHTYSTLSGMSTDDLVILYRNVTPNVRTTIKFILDERKQQAEDLGE